MSRGAFWENGKPFPREFLINILNAADGPGFFYFLTRRTALPLAGIEPAYLGLARLAAIHYTMPLHTWAEFLVD